MGKKTKKNLSFREATAKNINYLGIHNAGAPSQMYVDNISLVVPDPAPNVIVSKPIDIGSRRELFVDDFLIDSMDGAVQLQLHRPTRREIVFKTDAPWEGNASIFNSVFKDGDTYRMYYRGAHFFPDGTTNWTSMGGPQCLAESDDGIHWRRPQLSIHLHKNKPTNIITVNAWEVAVFKDTNPDCPPGQKYKVVNVGHDPFGLYFLGSPDGINFSPIRDKQRFMTKGTFDSQNIVFWDSVAGLYREYHRNTRSIAPGSYRTEMMKGEGIEGARDVRWVLTSTSKDLFSFSKSPDEIEISGAPFDGLYMSNIQPYYRAPHILMGFPARYANRGWSEPMYDLPGLDDRLARAAHSTPGEHGRNGSAITDSMFMTSRDGRTFKRWPEAFLRPGPREIDSWVYGDNYLHWGMVETKSTLQDAPNEISMYASEGYWQGKSTSFRRLTLRVDGFVSAHTQLAGGEIVTKPICFKGGNLTLNLETSAAGGCRVEIQDVSGKPIDGYALTECPPIFCDRVAQVVRWNRPGGDVRPLAGKTVRLRFVLKDADLYSFQFVPYARDPQRPDIPEAAKITK